MIKKSSNKPPLRCSLRPITSNDSVSPSKPELSDDELAGPSPPPNLNRTVDGYDVHQGNNPGPSRLNRSRPPVADHGRRFKKPKLDAGAENDELQPEIVEKRPLRGRDAQQEGHPTTAPVAARKLRRASNNTAALKMPSPPVPASQTSSAPRTGRGRGSPGAPHLTVNGDTDDQHMTTAPRPNGVTDNGIAEIPPAVKSSGFRASVARERRSLRSHDGISRSKSELALYFPNYEEVLSLQPTKPEFLSPDTTISLVDDLSESITPPSDPSKSELYAPRTPEGINPLRELYNTQTIELPTYVNGSAKQPQDPLTDDMYFKAHRRHERGEKQLRNIERERAQHEKIQLERLLSDLRGHDWLRVMGISGITDSEKKLYEPKRAYFIREVSALLDKFKAWKEEEKKRKLERDELLAAEDEDEDEDEDHVEEEEGEEEEEEGREGDQGNAEEGVVPESSNGTSPAAIGGPLPDIDDVDGWAAHQLQLEAMSATGKNPDTKAPNPPSEEVDQSRPAAPDKNSRSFNTPPPTKPEPPFTSFYDKPHLRAAALGQNRRGRTRMAFGKPLPDMPEQEFCLPEDILTHDAIIAARRRSRLRRREESKK